MHFIGIDPGQSGAIAVLDQIGGVVATFPLRETDADIVEFLRDFADADSRAVIEQVHASPRVVRDGGPARKVRMGASSAFTFGRSYGFLFGALTAIGIPFDACPPRKWQQALGCLSRGDKRALKARAQQLFPTHRVTLVNADALLIAEYNRRLHLRMLSGLQNGVEKT